MKRWALLLFMVGSPIWANAAFLVDQGETSAAFLKIPIAPRPLALGDSFTGAFGDVDAIHHNPAGLVGQFHSRLELSYQKYFEESALQAITIGLPSKSPVQTSSEGSPFIPRDQLYWGFHYKRFNSNDTARNDDGAAQRTFQNTDQLFKIGVGFAPWDQVSMGLSVGYITRQLDTYSTSGFVGDLGVLCFLSDDFSFGFSALNLGADQTFIDKKEPLPTTLKSGFRWQMGRPFLLLTDVAYYRDQTARASSGLEILLADPVKLRLGAAHQSDWEWTGGLGIMLSPTPPTPLPNHSSSPKNTLESLDWGKPTAPSNKLNLTFGLDYAIRSNNDLGITHTVALSLYF